MPAPLAAAARTVAERLRAAGHEAWLVGGAVRDLALEIEPHDADVATDARPEEVERCFRRTLAVGKAFGTIVVRLGEYELQVTTFRSERGYSDNRRPDAVEFGRSLEEDARRRDFTCNAMFLDPLSDALRDPEGGLEDLRRGVLRCVGDPHERFEEDGLRLMRLARMAAAFDLRVEDDTRAAARAHAPRLDGVSAERVEHELRRIAAGPAPGRALRLLADVDVLARVFPGAELDLDAVERLGPAPGPALLLACLLGPAADHDPVAALAYVDALRPSRELRRGLEGLWSGGRQLRALLVRGAGARRSERVRLVRRDDWQDLVAVQRARGADGAAGEALDALLAFADGLDAAALRPTPLLTSADLDALEVARGPLWSTVLDEAEARQLDGEFSDRAGALAWLRARVAT